MNLTGAIIHEDGLSRLLSRPYPFKFFKGCLPQNLLSPLLSTLSHLEPYYSGPILVFDETSEK